jgi:hypothetical protein
MGKPHPLPLQSFIPSPLHCGSACCTIGNRTVYEYKSINISVTGYILNGMGWGNSSRESYRFMERRFFMYSDAKTFCIELCKFMLEGLCTCIYGDYHSYIPAKTPRCQRGPFYPHKNICRNLGGGKILGRGVGRRKFLRMQYILYCHITRLALAHPQRHPQRRSSPSIISI